MTAFRLHKCIYCDGYVWMTRPAQWSHITYSARYGDWLNKGRKCASYPYPPNYAVPTEATYRVSVAGGKS